MQHRETNTVERLLALLQRMTPAQAQEVLMFAERLVGGTQDREAASEALRASFGMWRDRDDLKGDSTEIVRAMREKWEEREKRLGLA